MALSCTATKPTDDGQGHHLCVLDAIPEHATHRCGCDHDWGGAPRQAGTMTSGQPIGAVNVLRELGIAVRVGTLVPSGAAVRVDIDDTARWLDPSEARTLAVALEQAAVYAADQDRAARRG